MYGDSGRRLISAFEDGIEAAESYMNFREYEFCCNHAA
jgi:hypothetical protein